MCSFVIKISKIDSFSRILAPLPISFLITPILLLYRPSKLPSRDSEPRHRHRWSGVQRPDSEIFSRMKSQSRGLCEIWDFALCS